MASPWPRSYGERLPTVTSEVPRGTNRNGTWSGKTPVPLAVGVAVTTPSTVSMLPGPTPAKMSAGGSAATAEADIERVSETSLDW